MPVFHLSIYQTPNIHSSSENDYRAFDTAEIFVELKTMNMFACKNAFYKLTKVRTAYMRFSNIGNIQKEEKKHLIKKLILLMIRGKLTNYLKLFCR